VNKGPGDSGRLELRSHREVSTGREEEPTIVFFEFKFELRNSQIHVLPDSRQWRMNAVKESQPFPREPAFTAGVSAEVSPERGNGRESSTSRLRAKPRHV